ncbi:uroporphyrin-III methyltransferase [Acetobacter indonesiensis]|nr:uroporphyrin-III methyltransferase [Acetobacter indonesiensis]
MCIRRIYDDAQPDDGARVLVDRLWPRGISKDRAALTLWLKDVAPSTALRHWFGHDPARWDEFQKRYRAELDANPDAVQQLLAFARRGKLTLLYGARDTEHNEAVVLLQRLNALLAA